MTFIIDFGDLQTLEECLNSPDSLNTPLSPAEYCEAKRLLSPHLQWDWGRTNLSLGPPVGPPPLQGVPVPSQPAGPNPDDRRDEPVSPPTSADAMRRASVEALPGFASWNTATEYLIWVNGVLERRTNIEAPPFPGATPVQEEEEVAEWIDDLGDLADIVGGFFNPQPDVVMYDSGNPTVVPPPAANGGSPAAPSPAACATGASPVWKKVCGVYKWVYPKRRRRRQLLTNRDYDDLLKLQTLKVNANMTAAISKALTR